MSWNTNKKICAGCGEPRKIWKNRLGQKYCQPCWNRHPERDVKPPKQVSEKKSAQDRVYSVLRKEFLSQHPCCQAKLAGCAGCQGQDLQVHHKKGRGKYYLINTTWLAVCHSCHHYIEVHPEFAKAAGFSETRV
jgi:hypothetical protein